MKVFSISIWKIIYLYWITLLPLLLCSIIGLAVVIERFVFYWKIRFDINPVLSKIEEQLKRHQIKEALNICDSVKHPVAYVLKAGILKYDRPRSQIKEAMEDATIFVLPNFEKNIYLLATISYIAPLVGLLGTFLGLTNSFATITAKSMNQEVIYIYDIAYSIWQALWSATAGLVVAILTFIAYRYFKQRFHLAIQEIERASTAVLTFLTD
ncbi:MAG: MotA/TolQ/ExbB proton channel family protein [Candidatus Omnitrophica bacterium]|nr:MotA/TolQ/ExbB proton channel family protein [Candidatus Omnitrophota bacterium]